MQLLCCISSGKKKWARFSSSYLCSISNTCLLHVTATERGNETLMAFLGYLRNVYVLIFPLFARG